MSDDKRARLKQWLESGEAQLHPLTFPQRELWETSPVPPADSANHICCVIEVRGADRPGGLRGRDPARGRPAGGVAAFFPAGQKRAGADDSGSARKPMVQYRDVSPGLSTEAIEELALETFSKPFDLRQGPLYRVEMLRRAPDDQVHGLRDSSRHRGRLDAGRIRPGPVRRLSPATLSAVPEPLPPVTDFLYRVGRRGARILAASRAGITAAFWKSRLAGTKPALECSRRARRCPSAATTGFANYRPM